MSKEFSTYSPRVNTYFRNKKYKKHLEHLADIASEYPAAAYRVDKNGDWTDDPEDTKYVKRCYRENRPGISGYLKKLANRKVRRFDGEIGNYGAYKKVFDYWWNLY